MQLAQFISVLGHPLFMPAYSFGILIYFNPYINMMLTETSKQYILSVLVAFTIILPMLTVMVFKLFRLIDSVFMKTSKERILPFLVTLIWYYLGFQLLTKIYIPQIFLLITLFSVRDTILKFLSNFADLIICFPILPIHPVIAKFIFFMNYNMLIPSL